MTLINERLAGLKVASSFGELSFDEKGECKDLKAEQEKYFEGLTGYTVTEEKKQKPKDDKKEEAKEEKKAEEKKEEPKEEKKTKKTASKKDTNKK
ncbi:hypothetical protein [Bacillus phage SDFMU_Pbc]|uniref:DUF7349 domain-containing protein n=1 Tax=Bacillus phage SDFMU_Pbc TaxID=3076135 RepID=A0AA96KRW3_9CAUD|nr:hypothetical protein [Bacillus phage SDFMU_Pbc]